MGLFGDELHNVLKESINTGASTFKSTNHTHINASYDRPSDERHLRWGVSPQMARVYEKWFGA